MTIISSPVSLWRHLCSSAGLELRLKGGRPGRDADVEDSVRLSMAVPDSAQSLEAWLISDAASSHPKVSTEQLLIEVLKSQGGFARMMQDILDVLITADARQASHHLSVEFKFDDVTDPIKATLEQFREAVNRIQCVLEKRPKLPNDNLMWPLSVVLRSVLSTSHRNRPLDFPPVSAMPLTGHTGVDAQLACIVQLVSDFRVLWMRHGTTRQQVGQAALALRHTDADVDGLGGQLLAATDYWDMDVLSGAQEFSRQVISGQLAPEEAFEKLAEALNGIEWAENWVEHTVQELLDLLNLPAWRRRHELYSVWVGTQLLKVVERVVPDMQFHPVDGVLSFEFGGSRLATFNWGNKQFDIWAELRSALVGKSSKRKKGIQPDFRVLQAVLSKSTNANTTYVLECKHYLSSNLSNFTQAAADYARSCPNAVVQIVNHGPADELVLSAALPPELRSRAQFIGGATPLLEATTQNLSNAIQEALFPGLPLPALGPSTFDPVAGKAAQPVLPGSVGYVELEWDDSLDDMDLALRVIGPDGQVTQTVDFRNRGALNASPFAYFDRDVRHGPGKERIDIMDWHFSRYELVATNYSESGQMTPQALRCRIVTNKGVTDLRCPAGLATNYYEWKIAELIVNNGMPAIVPCDR